MRYQEYVFDEIGNAHPRKNLYLLDLAKADASKAKELQKQKDSQPYVVEYKAYKLAEKSFLKALKTESDQYFTSLSDSPKIRKFKRQLFEAEKKLSFYKDYIDLDYDADLEYKLANHKLKQIPEILDHQARLRKNLENKEAELASLNKDEVSQKENEFSEFRAKRNEKFDAEIQEIKSKKSEKLISAKAYTNEIKIAKRRAAEDIHAASYLNPEKSLREEIKNIKHHLKLDLKSQEEVLLSDLSDLTRKTPIEIEKTSPVFTFISFFLPGLGQLLNKQYVKAGLFFLGSLFIYLIAIPYALGYGNYQGEGIYGLISLAEDGARMDRSIIFMIEGIMAILFLIISILVFVFSFKDVFKTEKNEIKGIRVKSWFESKQAIESEGFPYLVSIPAYVLVAFIVLIPIITTFLISFTNMDPDHQTKFNWMGLDNYSLIARGEGIAGGAFWLILRWTIVWTIGATTLAIAIGFILSLIVNQDRIRAKKLFRTIYILPWAVPAFITIMFFSIMLARGGPLTEIINTAFNVSLDVKNNTTATRIALILLQGWLGSSYIFLLSTGVLQGIPNDLYEAAEIDGAKGFQQTLRITIPLVLFQTAPLLINQYTFNFNNFSIIYLFNRGGPFLPTLYGNLAGSSDLLISYIYKLTVQNKYQAVGAGITIMISLILMFISFLGYRETAAFKGD